MKYLIIIAAWLCTSAIAAQPAQPVSLNIQPLETLAVVDREMIEMLLLREDQIDGYLRVIRTQRRAFSGLSDAQWGQQLDLYRNTIEQLRTVLSEAQLAKFSAYLGCLIVEREYDMQLSME